MQPPHIEPLDPPTSNPVIAKTGRRERHKAEVRERLFRAAIDLYKTKGLQATTVREITDAADVGKGTFFNYFPTKEHVLAEHYARQPRIFEEALRSIQQGEPFASAIARTRARLREEARNPMFTRSFLLALVSNQAVFDMALPHLEATRRMMVEVLKVGQEQGQIRTDIPCEDLARVQQEAAFGTAFFWLCRPGTRLEELLERNVDVVLNASDAKSNAGHHRGAAPVAAPSRGVTSARVRTPARRAARITRAASRRRRKGGRRT
jgi:AcrR family transcriptional regulator